MLRATAAEKMAAKATSLEIRTRRRSSFVMNRVDLLLAVSPLEVAVT